MRECFFEHIENGISLDICRLDFSQNDLRSLILQGVTSSWYCVLNQFAQPLNPLELAYADMPR